MMHDAKYRMKDGWLGESSLCSLRLTLLSDVG